MSKIKMTQTIARILAERAKKQIEKSLEKKAEVIHKDVAKSKEYKQLEKLSAQIKQIEQQRRELVQAIEKNYSTPNIKVSVRTYSNDCGFSTDCRVYANDIMDDIIVKAHFADSGTTEEDLVKEIVASYI